MLLYKSKKDKSRSTHKHIILKLPRDRGKKSSKQQEQNDIVCIRDPIKINTDVSSEQVRPECCGIIYLKCWRKKTDSQDSYIQESSLSKMKAK